MAKRVLILSASVGSGHVTAGAALERAFRGTPGVEAHHTDALALASGLLRTTYSGVYFPMARVAPWLMELGYQAQHRPFANEPALPLWDRLNAAPLARYIRAFQPDITVCTHYMPANMVGHLLARGQIATSLAIATTDYDFHGSWFCQHFSRYFVATEATRAYCCALGLPAGRVVAAGIPVDPALAAPADRAALLARHGLRADQPIVLLSAGASGAGPARQVAGQLRRARADLQVVVVCGRSQALREAIAALVGADARFRVLGFCDHMPDLLRLATLFIGKPGGMAAAECMAAGLPMLIVEALPGQEERNCDHLLAEGAARRCRDLAALPYAVDSILGDPGLLGRMRAGARRLGRPNAARAIAELSLAEPLAPIRLSRAQRRQIVAAASGPARRSQ